MPSLTSPLILETDMVHGFPEASYSSVPGRATQTVCPAVILFAPQTIDFGTSAPTSTVVSDSLSAFGCFTQVNTLPATTPRKPPFTDSQLSTFSTSSPRDVSASLICSG